MIKKLYAAYGSNMNLQQMAHRCPDAVVVGVGKIKEHILIFRGYNKFSGVATIQVDISSKAKKDDVPVVVWEISESDEQSLDTYEGYPRFYIKKNFNIEMSNGQLLKDVMVYVMQRGYPVGCPSEQYLNTIIQGYMDNAVDTEFLFKAVEYTAKMIRL